MKNSQVAHIWANKSQPAGHGYNFYFEGDVIYSYGSHFPIARHYKGSVLFTKRGYSTTTAQHINRTRAACNHLPVFYVANPMAKPGKSDVQLYAETIKSLIKSAEKARKPWQHLGSLERTIKEANLFCETFGFKTRFSHALDSQAIRTQEAEYMAKESERENARIARRDADQAQLIEKWLKGEIERISVYVDKVYLRAKAGNLETSQGASVPLRAAEITYRFIASRRNTGWHTNGEVHHIGDNFTLSAVNESGIVAGCHRISWDIIDAFAQSMGWAH